jgi:hypothetical protein
MVKLLMLQAMSVGLHPIEFDCLVGKMLFVIDRSLKQPVVSDGSYRIKRICMNPIIDEFCSQGPYFTPIICCAKYL